MKRNHLLPILLLAVGLTITSEHSVRAAGNKQAAEQATILVKQALQAEVNGDAAERERLLAEALKLDPNCAAAHWQLGKVRRGAKWLKIENVPQDIENDRLLRAYRERRDALDRNHARLHAVDEAGLDRGEWDSVETKEFVLKRTEGLRAITDDNMGLEWEHQH